MLLHKQGDAMLALLVTRLIAKADSGPLYLQGVMLVEQHLQRRGELVGASLCMWRRKVCCRK